MSGWEVERHRHPWGCRQGEPWGRHQCGSLCSLTEMTTLYLRHARSTAEELEKQLMREMVFPGVRGPDQLMVMLSLLGTDTCRRGEGGGGRAA